MLMPTQKSEGRVLGVFVPVGAKSMYIPAVNLSRPREPAQETLLWAAFYMAKAVYQKEVVEEPMSCGLHPAELETFSRFIEAECPECVVDLERWRVGAETTSTAVRGAPFRGSLLSAWLAYQSRMLQYTSLAEDFEFQGIKDVAVKTKGRTRSAGLLRDVLRAPRVKKALDSV